MVEKTWVGGFNTSNNTTNNTTTELKPTQPSFRRNLHSPGFIQLNQILGPLVVNNEISVPLPLSKKNTKFSLTQFMTGSYLQNNI